MHSVTKITIRIKTKCLSIFGDAGSIRLCGVESQRPPLTSQRCGRLTRLVATGIMKQDETDMQTKKKSRLRHGYDCVV